MGSLTTTDRRHLASIELPGMKPCVQHRRVDRVDVFVGRRGDRHRPTRRRRGEPLVGDRLQHTLERVGDDAVMRQVGVETARVAVSQ